MIRPFNPISTLRQDHRDILAELVLVEKDLHSLGKGGHNPTRWQNVRNAMEYLADRVQLHAEQEDEALFPALREFPELAPAWQTVVEQDRYMHEAFDGLRAMWRETEAKHKLGQSYLEAEIPFLVHKSLALIEVLRAHMGFEEEHLFEFAERQLGEEQLGEIARRMAEIRNRYRLTAGA